MKLLLVGHGYLGRAIRDEFVSAGWEVTAVSLSGGDGSVASDVADMESVRSLPGADFMIHCAASGKGGAEAYQRVYVDGCRNLTTVFPGVPLLFTSSTSVYAQIDGSVVDENSPAEPDRDTGKLLLEAEQIVMSANGIVTRLAGIYGPGRSVILRKFLTGQAIIEEDGSRYLNQIHRDDAARGILLLATNAAAHGGNIFNVSDSTPLTQLACYQALAKIFLKPLPPRGPRDLDRKRGWTQKQVLNARLVSVGWQPRFPSFIDAVRTIAPTLELE